MKTKTDIDTFDGEELLALAQLSFERKDLEGALLKLKGIIERADPPPEAVGLAARVYAQLRLFDKAETLFERYLQANPKALLEQFELGMTRFDAGKLNEALHAWDVLLKEQPIYPPAMFYKALLHARTGKPAEAKQILEQLLKTVPVDNLYFGRGKELLQSIESGANPEQASAKKVDGRIVPPDPYRTEH